MNHSGRKLRHGFDANTTNRIGQVLLRRKSVEQDSLTQALGHQKKYGLRLGECLLQMGAVEEEEFFKALAISRKLPFVNLKDLSRKDVKPAVLNLIPKETAQQERIVPLAVKPINGKRQLAVATCEPNNISIIQDLEFQVNMPIFVLVASAKSIRHFTRNIYQWDERSSHEAKQTENLMEMFSMHQFDILDEESIDMGVMRGPYQSFVDPIPLSEHSASLEIESLDVSLMNDIEDTSEDENPLKPNFKNRRRF